MIFETSIESITSKIRNVDPIRYAATRNFIDGGVTRLSPYISRGVISTRMVFLEILKRGVTAVQAQKMIQELMWRDYYQRVWMFKMDSISKSLRHEQTNVSNTGIPASILQATTGIESIDNAIHRLYETGYMHNHLRMYIASITCNVGQSHWKIPSDWLYYHLLDADGASNTCSWQWVVGAFSEKKYFANQENINKYTYSNQRNTFLDVPYEQFKNLSIPKELSATEYPVFRTTLPERRPATLISNIPTLLYNVYNLDPFWRAGEQANRILLLEPSHFHTYPMAQKSIDFIISLSRNISNVQLYIGEFEELLEENKDMLPFFHYKEHPTNSHYRGIQEERDWICPEVHGFFPSFFGYWKKCEKIIHSYFK
jgi:deoxyribodipyrimidine photo-lyase